MHKMEFGQAYCRDLLKRNPRKFMLHFSKFYFILYGFLKFIQISRNLNEKMNLEKIK
jgi:hypothetical protein